jgi:hypothetical protein
MNSIGKYILDGHTPVPCDDLDTWAQFVEQGTRRVAFDQVTPEVRVSTIFLALDHDFSFEDHPPILFETMVFGGALNHFQERYCTWDEAELGHQAILANVIEVEELERMNK